MNNHEFCIYDFNQIDKLEENDESVFHIQIFAKNMEGHDASITIQDYEPFFYIKLPSTWKGPEKNKLFEFLQAKLGTTLGQELLSSSLIQSKTLYGFDNGKKYNFMILRFSNMIAFNKCKSYWFEYADSVEDPATKEYCLKEKGLYYNKVHLQLYEANIPPILRYLHIRKISPSGWIKIDSKKAHCITEENDKTTHCAYEYISGQRYVTPLPEKEDRPPLNKMSMDCEMSSSHGDFPVPVKNYKKLASQMIELFLEMPIGDKVTNEVLQTILVAALTKPIHKDQTASNVPKIDLVFPKEPIEINEVNVRIQMWLKAKVSDYANDANVNELKKLNTLDKMFSKNNMRETTTTASDKKTKDDNDDNSESDNDESDNDDDNEEPAVSKSADIYAVGEYFQKDEKLVRCTPKKPKTTTIVDIINDSSFTKEGKLTELLLSLNSAFPALQGDIVTFIGSTFLREGEKDMYLNHCIVLNTCDRLPTSNSVVEVYDTEREVLLAWTRLMHRENPDIVIGYNIFGFDYEFMFRRAKECGCADEFLTLSKNKNQMCAKYDFKTQEYDIERSSITISTGTYDLSIIKMPGRLQVDLLNYFRRTTIMSSYKLDSVASDIIGDQVISKEFLPNKVVRCLTKNMMGLSDDCWVHFILENHSSKYFNGGKKYRITKINTKEKWFEVEGFHSADDLVGLTAKTVKWGLAKDDVTPKDIFRLTHEGPASRAIVAKYCIQDCNLVHHLFNKVDVLTGLAEMAKLCSVPMSYLVFRGQGIKLTSFLGKKCRERGVLMPVIRKGSRNDAYEGAIVLDPFTGIYLDDAIAIGDFASLYPSGMQSDNLCLSSKVWQKVYDLDNKLVKEVGEKDDNGNFIYDNLPGHKYVDIPFKTYAWTINPLKPKAKAKRLHTGSKVCRFEQTEAILPSILKELLKARKNTRKLIPGESDPFMQNILNQRQNAYKVTANSLYGQTGAKTSTFYEPDVAASTTAIGRKCLIFAKKIIEDCYGEKDMIMSTKEDGDVLIKPAYVYGDTDSVFFKLNCRNPVTKTPIVGELGVKITIELSQIICHTISKFLKMPHDFEYEKTYWPFIIPSKKRYVGEKYGKDCTQHKRNNMGGAAVKRDSAPITKDLLGRVTDVIMMDKDLIAAINVVTTTLTKLVAGEIGMDQLVITKSLGSSYKNPKRIAHKVLADRIAEREPGNKPTSGDRIPFVYIINPEKQRIAELKGKAKKDAPKILGGECIDTPTFIKAHANTCKIDYGYYITNQLNNPLSQMFALALEDIMRQQKKEKVLNFFQKQVKLNEKVIRTNPKHDKLTEAELLEKINKKNLKFREKTTSDLIFGPFIKALKNSANKNQDITKFMGLVKK